VATQAAKITWWAASLHCKHIESIFLDQGNILCNSPIKLQRPGNRTMSSINTGRFTAIVVSTATFDCNRNDDDDTYIAIASIPEMVRPSQTVG
jgi:hypothetical protein